MELTDHQGKYDMNPSERNNEIIGLNIYGAVLAHNMLLTKIVNELKKKLSKLLQQLK